VINSDAVTRYHRVVTYRYNEIHILVMPHITQQFNTQVGTTSIRKHSDAD